MKFAFQELPGTAGPYTRPLVPLMIDGLPRAPQLCLLDTGAIHNRMGRWIAEAAGIPLHEGTSEQLAVGGFVTTAVTVPVPVRLGDHAWQAPIAFCDPWPLDFGLLGQEGFFRFFTVVIRASRYEVDCTPDDGAGR